MHDHDTVVFVIIKLCFMSGFFPVPLGFSGVGTYLSGTARAVPLLKVGRLVMHFAVPLFGHRLHIALMIDSRTVLCSRGVYISYCQ